MQNWYQSTNVAQRTLMFLLAFVAAFFGVTYPMYRGENVAFVLVLPLILLIYLQLGTLKKKNTS